VPVMYILNLTPLGGPAALLSNYHLGPGSNAIDQGVSVPWVTVDIDLDARPRGKGPDVGADEFSCLARTGLIDYSVVQDAIDAAGALAKVKVAEGTCYENLSIAKTITLEGGYPAGDWDEDHRYAAPAAHTTIDGLGAGRVISITEPPSSSIAPVIDGLTLTGGDATGLRGGSGVEDVGGGIYGQDADITVQDCAIVGNVASRKGTGWGGGIGTYQCNVILKSNLIASNTAALIGEGSGGGVALRIAKRVV
jgi:hypothetical protein